MENSPASIPTPIASSDDPSAPIQIERPEQGKFSKAETDFLKKHLSAYGAFCHELGQQATGPRGTGSVKGRKKDWILLNVYPEFVKQFSSNQSGGPQLQSLQTKLSRWFANRSPHRQLTITTSIPTSKRLRVTNGASVFAEEHKEEITERMAEKQAQEGGIPNQVNLPRYHAIKQELYNQLTAEEQCAYEVKATKKNEAGKALPEKFKIFENQENIVGGVVKTLNDLIGWNWGQYGEAAFFVQGAYRNASNDIKTFNVSVGPNAKITSFSSTIPDYKKALRAPFREWAEHALPVHLSPLEGATEIAANVIELQEDGQESPAEGSVPVTITASPVTITPPQLSPPLSESTIRSAIENVAEAGYLSISDATAIDAPNLVPQQSGGKTETSNSKKRRREEQDEDKKMNKRRGKVAVPAREQSSRLKDANYKNKNVTVRPR